jgi:peptidoglycan/LPS O-acetylase OafA/YrhL
MFGVYRFILALNVMLFLILQVPDIGPLAVYSFFILSGFLMTTIMHQSYGYTTSGFKKYCTNRFLRLYPSYWLLALIIVLIIFIVGPNFAVEYHPKMIIPDSVGEVLTNFTMVFPSFHPGEYSPRLAPPAWAITIELFFYVLIGLGISRNKSITWVWFISSILYIIITKFSKGSFLIGYGNILTASLPFSIGAMVFYYQQKVFSIMDKKGYLIYLLFALFICNVIIIPAGEAIFPDFYQQQGWKIRILVTWFNLPLSALITVALLNTKSQKSFFRKFDSFLGNFSYPIYIFHSAAACLVFWFFTQFGTESITKHNGIIFIPALLLTLFVSYLNEKFVNSPIDLYRAKIKKDISP